jgi:NAD-dependent deacetylase
MGHLNPTDYKKILFFTGAGMSAESGIPTFRGKGGIWSKYNWEEYACQEAFDENPEKVLKFHEMRRKELYKCHPNKGHEIVSEIEKKYGNVVVVTQNIDGLHQRAGSQNVIELHGSAWRLRCPNHGIIDDMGASYKSYKCPDCESWFRPDIIWFGDMLNQAVIMEAIKNIESCDLFISIGTSAVVYPAAGFPQIAKEKKAECIEINPEQTALSYIYDTRIRKPVSEALEDIFKLK